MDDDKLKAGALVLLLLAALVVFDYYSNFSSNQLTGAVSYESELASDQCIRANPTVTLSPDYQEAAAGTAVTYKATIVNNDNSACAPRVFQRWGTSSKLDDTAITGIYPGVYVTDEFAGEGLPQIYPGNSLTFIFYVQTSDDAKAGAYTVGMLVEGTSDSIIYSAQADAKLAITGAKVYPADCSKGETATIREGETRTYEVGSGNTYEITADFVSSLTAVLTVNGEIIRAHELGEFELLFGAIVKTFTTKVDNRPYGIQFCLKEATDPTTAVIDVLNEGETKTYTVAGNDYTISANFVSGVEGVKFSVNGVLNKQTIISGGRYDWAKISIEVLSIEDKGIAGGIRTVKFKIRDIGQTGLPTPSPIAAPVLNTTNITQGWNIVGVGTLYGLQSTTCDRDNIYKTVYSYNPGKGDYDTCELTGDLSPGQCFEMVKAVWLYNFGGKCAMQSYSGVASDWTVSLKSGWNMLQVQRPWTGKSLARVVGTCKPSAGYFYEPSGWVGILGESIFELAQVGKGFWIYVDGDCSFLTG